jgi:hypothetical protein
MKFGVREICDVVLKAKDDITFGKLKLKKGMPVIYFDTLKTSTLEGAATTVYAQGGKGNPRLVAWEGDRTVTFTMEDALISPESFSVLSGAGLIDASDEAPIYVHATQQVAVKGDKIVLDNKPAAASGTGAHEEAVMYVMFMNEGTIDSSIPPIALKLAENDATKVDATNPEDLRYQMDKISSYILSSLSEEEQTAMTAKYGETFKDNQVLYVDYYIKATTGVKQIDIEAGKFGGSYYLEASTLFRDQATGTDHAAEFVIPNCKVQSNFTFTMAPSGDPSTFTFTMDAFPDYTKFDGTKKVIAALQIVENENMGAVTL